MKTLVNNIKTKGGIIFLSLFLYMPFINAHDDKRNEVGFSTGYAYDFSAREWGPDIHFHYFRTVAPNSKLSLGVGFDLAWINGNPFTVSPGIKYEFIEDWKLYIFPGITFYQDRRNEFTVHFELVYEFLHLGNFHLGAVVDYGWSRSSSQAMLGIHAAFGF